MAEVYKEIAKLDGIPVTQTVVMGVSGQAAGQPSGQPSGDQQQQAPPADKPTVSGALGGMLGIHRSKKSSSDPPPDSSSGSSQPGSLLEMTTELSGFSSAAVDDAMFDVPPGFKKVDAPTRRQ